MTGKIRVLCLDIEGGYGGSSRSLYHTLAALDRTQVEAEVWCKRSGPIQAMYDAIGIPVRVEPKMPKASALPRLSRNIYQAGLYIRDFLRAADFRRRLATAAQDRFDLVHFNHEALAGLAFWLHRTVGVPATMHMRTNVQPGIFAHLQMAMISHGVDRRVFITANEEKTYLALGGRGVGRVIFNPVAVPKDVAPSASVPQDGRLKIASLSNFAWVRGVDRLVDLAAILKQRGRKDILFVVAGDMALQGNLPAALTDVARRGGSFADYAATRGVADMFVFLGHVANPESVLQACDLLAKLTREDNPWGRDVLEAMAAGRPVLSVGQDRTFVESGSTGILQPEFDAQGLADHLIYLADHRDVLLQYGRRAVDRVVALCHPQAVAAEISAEWCAVLESRRFIEKGIS